MRERYQRPRIRDLGTKWKIFYWDYSAGKRRGRTKSWSKNSAPTRAETQRLADQFMEEVNDRNNQPLTLALKGDTLEALIAICREKMWPLLKNSTRISYDFYLDTHILPRWGTIRVVKMRTLELQDFFNSFSPRLASRTIRNMHACLRAVLNQGKVWGLIRVNPAVGVRLPRKKARKPPVLLSRQDIRRVIDELPEPTKSIVTLIVVGSLRVGEAVALRWGRVLSDRIEVTERFYAGEFDDAKTDAGRRSIPLDSFGILRSVLDRAWARSKRHEPEDLIFTNARGGPLDRHNLSHRHLKPAIKKLGLPPTVDFRSFRTMHSSLMSSVGVRPEVTRDNMGHATIDVTQNVYNKTWWEERAAAVSLAAASVWKEFQAVPCLNGDPKPVNVNPGV
ncbi:MAG: tyrosine-type recombinase/integrase [Terracidiphilus sp.]